MRRLSLIGYIEGLFPTTAGTMLGTGPMSTSRPANVKTRLMSVLRC